MTLALRDLSEVLCDLLLVLCDLRLVYCHMWLAPLCATRLVVGADRLVTCAARCPHVHPKFPLVFWGVSKLIKITPVVLLNL
jgi:hypothetical protein